MTTVTETRGLLNWGMNVAPEEAPAAWGARAIIEGASFGLLHDRQGVRSDDNVARQRLVALLNGGVIRKAQGRVAELRLDGTICGPNGEGGDTPGSHVLYEDDAVKVMGDTHGSHGYLYLAAWLKTEAP